MAASTVGLGPFADFEFFTGPASGPESEDEKMAEVQSYFIFFRLIY